MEKEENENRKENSRTALDGKLRVFKARLRLSFSENVFCQGMVVLLNPVCNGFLKCFMFIRAKYVLQFSRCNDRQNTAIDPAIENRRIVWTLFALFEAAGRKVACENSRPSSLPARVAFHGCFCRREGKRKVAFHTITDFTLLHFLRRNYK